MRCRHGNEGVCLACGGDAVRRGLDPIAGAIGGFFIRRDTQPGTPVDEGRWKRYLNTGQEQDALFHPLSGVAAVSNPAHFREVSPTGKRGGGAMYARLTAQDFAGSNTNPYLLLDPRATPTDARRVTRAQVDPWGSTVGKASWSPGKMAQSKVIG